MYLLAILLISLCFVMELQGKTKGKHPHHKHKHRQWLKHPLYIPPGKHYIDERIQPTKSNPMKLFLGIGHKIDSGPKQGNRTKGQKIKPMNSFYRKTGQAGFNQIPMYNAKTRQAGFNQIPMYNTKPGQAGFNQIPMYNAKPGQAGFNQIPTYNAKPGQAGLKQIPLYGKTALSQIPAYQTMTGQAAFNQVPSLPGVASHVPVAMGSMFDMASQTQPMQTLYSPTAVQGMDAPFPAGQMNIMYPGLFDRTGLSSFENGALLNSAVNQQGLDIPARFPGLTSTPMFVNNEAARTRSIADQVSNQVKPIVGGPKEPSDPSFTVSIDGVVRSFANPGESGVHFNAGDASISLSKKNKVPKHLKWKTF